MGRQHSVTNDSFREAKLHGPLYGSELEKWADVSRPIPAGRCVNGSTAGIGVEHLL